jgi:hypothetical protein
MICQQGLGLAPFQASEVSEPNADFLQSTSAALNTRLNAVGCMVLNIGPDTEFRSQLQASMTGWGVAFRTHRSHRSGFDPAPEQFSVSTGASILDLKPVLLASDSPWDIESLQFSFR